MKIQFTKAHGAGNDFLLVREGELAEADLALVARSICDRTRGVGADGLIIFTGPTQIRLFNSDGTEAELSGNGTRCAAAVLIAEGSAGDAFTIETLAGPKRLRLLERDGNRFRFEMDMGRSVYSPENLKFPLETSMGPWTVT